MPLIIGKSHFGWQDCYNFQLSLLLLIFWSLCGFVLWPPWYSSLCEVARCLFSWSCKSFCCAYLIYVYYSLYNMLYYLCNFRCILIETGEESGLRCLIGVYQKVCIYVSSFFFCFIYLWILVLLFSNLCFVAVGS